jgi:acyl-CoA thioesterase FadM
MDRIKIDLPEVFHFSALIPVRITDLNFAGHTGNDSILSIIHEARAQFLKSLGYTELDFGGTGTIMSNVAIEYKKEMFYGDPLIISVAAGNFSKVSFDLFYKLETVLRQARLPDGQAQDDQKILIAAAKTGMVCYDYNKRKITAIPEIAKQKLSGN